MLALCIFNHMDSLVLTAITKRASNQPLPHGAPTLSQAQWPYNLLLVADGQALNADVEL